MAIRVTQAWKTQSNINRLTQSRSEIASLQEKAFTGKNVKRASDAPQEWVGIETLQSSQRDQSVYAQNADRAQGILNAQDRALGAASDILKRVRELGIGASSEVALDDHHSAAADEMASIREQLVGLANQEYAGRFLFAGTAYDSRPFDDAGNYLGNTEEPAVRVSRENTVIQGMDGSGIFKGPIDVFQVIDDFQAALQNEDSDAVFDLLDEMADMQDQVVDSRRRVGVYQSRTEDLAMLATEMDTTLQQLVSNKTDSDPISIYTQIQSMQSTYEATLQISASSFQRSLFQFL